MADKFKNKDGSLTAYALACGYIQYAEIDGVSITLTLDGCYHVRAHNYNEHARITWESTRSLVQAKKRYKQIVRLVKSGDLNAIVNTSIEH